MKYEWRKVEKELYLSKGISTVEVPAMKFITITGQGDPNAQDFSAHIQALYPVAYAIRMALKKGVNTPALEYTVYPLEGVWTTTDGSMNETLNKNALAYKIMIRQPDQVTAEMFAEALAATKAKKADTPYLDELKFEEYAEGLAVQKMHTGEFDDEGQTFGFMQEYMEKHGLEQITTMGDYQHREIYLSDFRKVEPAQQKTMLRYRVQSV